MELQKRTIRVCHMIEHVVRETINPKWQFTKSGAAALYVQKGIEGLGVLFPISGYDDERIVDYLVYQLYRQRSFLKKGTWRYTWLFSESSMEKYKRQFMSEDGKSGMNYYINQWLDEADLSRKSLTIMIGEPKPNTLRGMVYLPSEEPIKKRFFNTEEGFALCQSSTTGWSPLSDTCGSCDNWIECEKLTAKKYPALMRYRREEYGKQKK